MLLVPYDNDMWLRYESCVPAAGRPSYDVTAIYDEQSLEGMVIGALDFDVWKNAIRWNPHDARSVIAFCGIADGGTHDVCPHGGQGGLLGPLRLKLARRYPQRDGALRRPVRKSAPRQALEPREGPLRLEQLRGSGGHAEGGALEAGGRIHEGGAAQLCG